MYNNTKLDTSQPLFDKSPSGKERPWARHRSEAEILAVAYAEVNPAKMERILECAPRLIYAASPESGEPMKLDTAWFCRVRLCPVCQWRRSLKIYGQMAEIIKAANTEAPGGNGYGWCMLTLTVRNVDGEHLSETISHLLKSWDRMSKTAAWKRVVLGTMRTIEITHNTNEASPSFDTYHPHIHTLLCVRRSYFRGQAYIPQSEWRAMWERAARLDYTSQVDIRRVGSRTMETEQIIEQIMEVTKYATKPGDYISASDVDFMQKTVSVLDKALHHRRLVAWTGNLKEIHKKLELDDIDEGDLIHTSDDQGPAEENHLLITYQWLRERRNYFREV